MNIRLYNCRILTMANGFEIEEGEIWVQKDRISFVGKEKISDLHWDREIDVRRNLVMPGFKDAHTHSGMTFLRSYADDLPLMEWLHNRVFPIEAKLTPEDVCVLSKLAIMEYLTSGITANFDMYFLTEPTKKAAVECGFRTVLCGAINDFSQSLEEIEEYYNRYQSWDENISFILGFHAEYTTSELLLKGIAKLSQKYKTPVFSHNSETEDEVLQCIRRHDMTPTVYMNELGLFEYGGGGFHCVHMSDEDIQIFKEKGLSAVTNPASNMKLASGIPPVQKMMEQGINIAIGTDGPASNNCLDMFREMFLTTGLAKIRERDARAVDANQVLYMATVGGATAMGLKECDCLAPGKKADLIVIDLQQPNMQPIHNITKNLVYSGSKQNVKMTMVNGRILYEDGEFYIGISPGEVYKRVNTIVKRLI